MIATADEATDEAGSFAFPHFCVSASGAVVCCRQLLMLTADGQICFVGCHYPSYLSANALIRCLLHCFTA